MEVLAKTIRSNKPNLHRLVHSEHRTIGLFLTHLGLGDLINMNGAIRYLTQDVDTMYVVCKTRNSKNVSQMFEDDPKIKILDTETDPTDYEKLMDKVEHYKGVDTIIQYFSGCWVNRTDFDDIPNVFYDDLKLDRSIRHSYFKLNIKMKLPVPEIPYIFVHSTSSSGQVNLDGKFNRYTTLVIDPNINHYTERHKWYSIAEQYLNKPLFEYVDVIENATEIHVTDSSFYCLACYLNTKASVKICYDRETGKINDKYTFN